MYLLILLFAVSGLYGMEEILVSSPMNEETDKAIIFFLGKSSPVLTHNIAPLLRKRISNSDHHTPEMLALLRNLDTEKNLSDSQEMDIMLKELRTMVADCVADVLKSHDEDKVDAQLQLALKEKDLTKEKYKFYAALAAVGGTAITSIVTIATIVIANNS